MSLIARLFGKGEVSAEILCPHCERAMGVEHDADNCARKRMSRRFFFGVLGGAAAAVAVGPAVVEAAVKLVEFPVGLHFSHATFMRKVDVNTLIGQMVAGRKSYLYDTLEIGKTSVPARVLATVAG